MQNNELTPEQVREKMERHVAHFRKWYWYYRALPIAFVILFAVAFFRGELKGAIMFQFCATVFLLNIMRLNQYKLVLKMLPPTR